MTEYEVSWDDTTPLGVVRRSFKVRTAHGASVAEDKVRELFIARPLSNVRVVDLSTCDHYLPRIRLKDQD